MHILIATVTAGGGHLVAAAALEEAWRVLRPNDTVERVDLLKFFSPLHRKIYAEGWVKIASRAPELWGMVFGRTDRPEAARRLRRIRRLLPSPSALRFTRFLKQSQPDVVLCTHYVPVELLGNLKHTRSPAGSSPGRPAKTQVRDAEVIAGKWTPSLTFPFVASVVTDFEVHALWMEPGVNLYCVASEEAKARLVARGAIAGDIVATGIPIAARFSTKPAVRSVRKALGLRTDLPLMLVLSGGFGMGPVGRILAELDKVGASFQTVVVCGRNDQLRQELAGQDRQHPTRVLGFASNMHELMATASLIITKPGGLTSSEALALGRPLLILDPIPGQEAANSDYLLERGAAAKVNRVEDLPFRVGQLLGSKKLADMGKAAKKLGRPDAAVTVCRETLARLRAIA